VRARGRGAAVIVMNVDDPDVVALYGQASVVRVDKTKCIGNKASSADRHREAIFFFGSAAHLRLWDNLSDHLVAARPSTQLRTVRGAA